MRMLLPSKRTMSTTWDGSSLEQDGPLPRPRQQQFGVNLASAEDQVRDMVNRNLAQCGQAYIVDVLRRLQDRQRSLHHCLRLKLVAMEEVTTWFSTSVHSQPRIAAMFETASGTRLPDGSRKGILYASSSVCGCTGGSSVAGLS